MQMVAEYRLASPKPDCRSGSEICGNPARGARFRALLTFGQRLSFCAIHEAGFMAWAIDQRS
jgi:hypothetical protein